MLHNALKTLNNVHSPSPPENMGGRHYLTTYKSVSWTSKVWSPHYPIQCDPKTSYHQPIFFFVMNSSMRQVQLPFAPVPAMPASLPQTASTCGVTRIPPPAPKRPRPTTRSMGREAKRQATEAVPRCSSEPTATPPTDGVAVAQISWRNCKPQTPTKLKVEVAKAEEDLNSNSVVEDTAGLPVVHNIPSAVLQKPKGTPAYIIDKHHDALLPIFGGIFDTQTLPSTGLKLLHLDSHPDMACLPDNTPKTLMAGLHKGAYNHTHLHKKCDIATWVLPLVLGGHVDEVVWMCSWWCLQMEPGTYELQIGVQQNVMKVAPMVDSDQTEEGVGLYWMSSNSWVPAGTLKDPRPWKLHVCRLTRAGQLQDKDVQLIRRVTGSGPWLLDFDEDFVSCCNPFQEEFKAFFGVPQYSMLRRTYEPKVCRCVGMRICDSV